MNKYYKKILAVAISIITVISICMSVIFVATANTTPDPYGTEEKGIEDALSLNVSPTEGLKNADFSEGFKYWGTNRTYYKISQVSEIQSESTNKFVRLKTETGIGDTDWNGFTSAAFNIDKADVKPGDKITVVYDWRGDNAPWVWLDQIGLTGGNVNEIAKGLASENRVDAMAINQGWNASYSTIHLTVVEDATPEDNAYTFYIYAQFAGNDKKNTDFDNFRIYKADEQGKPVSFLTGAAGGSTQLDEYGTTDKGITSGLARKKTPTDGFKNFDFSEGFRYWGNDVTYQKLENFGELVTDGENKYLKLKENLTGFPDPEWAGAASVAFKIPETSIPAGSKITVMYDFKGGVKGYVFLRQILDTHADNMIDVAKGTSSDRIASGKEINSGWTAAYSPAVNAVTADNTDDGCYTFYIYTQFSGDNSEPIYFDNFRIYLTDAIGNPTTRIAGADDGSETGGNPGDGGGSGDGSGGDSGGDTPIDEYGTADKGIVDKFAWAVNPTDGLKNFDFSEDFRYWGYYWQTQYLERFAEIVKDGDNKFIRLHGGTTGYDSPEWAGCATAAFNVPKSLIPAGSKVTVMYDWQGEAPGYVWLRQVGLPDGATNNLAQGTNFENITDDLQINDGWFASYSTAKNAVVEDATPDDGYYTFYIFAQLNGVTEDRTIDFDNFRIYGTDAQGKAQGYLLGAKSDKSEIVGGGEGDDEEYEDEDYGDFDDSYSDNTNTGNNTGNSSSGNSNVGSSSGNTSTEIVDFDSIDIADAMDKLNKLKSGEDVDFINLFSFSNDKGTMDAYISVKTLSEDELENIKAMTETDVKNTAVVLRAILSTMTGNPDMENAKAFARFGGNTSKTLPLSFEGHINLGFTANIRIGMGENTLDSEKTYYAYHCDANTRELSNLGKVYLEKEDGNLYATIRTNKFADFFITEDNLKPKSKQAEIPTQENGINVWLIVGIVSGVLVIAAATVLLIIFLKKKRIK